jgi:hypothetical protein
MAWWYQANAQMFLLVNGNAKATFPAIESELDTSPAVL